MQTINLDKLPPQARLELQDFYEFLLEKYTSSKTTQFNRGTQPRIGDLAVKLFGSAIGVELDLPKHQPHEPLELE